MTADIYSLVYFLLLRECAVTEEELSKLLYFLWVTKDTTGELLIVQRARERDSSIVANTAYSIAPDKRSSRTIVF